MTPLDEHIEALRTAIMSIERVHDTKLRSEFGPSQVAPPEVIQRCLDAMKRDLEPWQKRLADALAMRAPSILLEFDSKEAADAFRREYGAPGGGISLMLPMDGVKVVDWAPTTVSVTDNPPDPSCRIVTPDESEHDQMQLAVKRAPTYPIGQ